MDRLEFKSIEELVERVVEVFEVADDTLDYPTVSIVAKYEEAQQIIKELVGSAYDYNISFVKIEDTEYGDYEDEYSISIFRDYENPSLSCEPLKRGDTYIWDTPDVAFIFD